MSLTELDNKINSIIYQSNSLESVVKDLNTSTNLEVRIFGQYREIGGEKVRVCFHNFDITENYTFIKVEFGRRFKEFTVYVDNLNIKTAENAAWFALALFKQWYNENQ